MAASLLWSVVIKVCLAQMGHFLPRCLSSLFALSPLSLCLKAGLVLMAQLVAHWSYEPKVRGSTPCGHSVFLLEARDTRLNENKVLDFWFWGRKKRPPRVSPSLLDFEMMT